MRETDEKEGLSFTWFLRRITRPLTPMHILSIIVVSIYILISTYFIFFADKNGYFWVFLGLLMIISLVLSLLILFSKLTISRLFSAHDGIFARKFESGFFILFAVGIIRIILDATNSLLRNYWLPHIYQESGPDAFETWSMWISMSQSVINIVLVLLLLLAYYRFVSGMRAYNKEKSA